MTPSLPDPVPFVSSRRIRFLTQITGQDNTFVYLCFSEPYAGVFRSERGVSTLVNRIERGEVMALVERGIVVEFARSVRGVRYRRSGGAARGGVTAAERRKAKFLQAERFFQGRADAPAVAVTVNLGESPLGWLSRRQDAQGRPFLTQEEVDAGERLRADFERAQLGPSVTQDWRRFLTPGGQGGGGSAQDRNVDGGAEAARQRVMDALGALGPGLADAALRICCFLEGLETVEARMSWSARSGKIVLKIALQRLADHFRRLDSPVEHGEIRTWRAPPP